MNQQTDCAGNDMRMKNLPKRIKKVPVLIMALIMAVTFVPLPGNTAAAADGTGGVTTAHKADVVVFVQFADTKDTSGNSSENFMAESSGEIDYVPEPDVQYTRTQTAAKYFTGDGSLDSPSYPLSFEKYISDISGGQLAVNCIFPQYDVSKKVIKAYQAKQNKSYYENENDEFDLVNEVTGMLNERGSIENESQSYDGDGDGYVDDLTIVTADSPSLNNDFSAHSTNLFGLNKKIGSKSVGYYNILKYSDITGNGAGVISHEFMHTLGYPDLYNNNTESGTQFPVGGWDIMSEASRFMAYPLAYMRQKISGWVDLDEVTGNGTYTLESMAGDRDKQAVIIRSPMSDNEFFVAEYRVKGSSAPTLEADSKIGGSGLIFYRVNTDHSTNIQGDEFIHVFHRGNDTKTDIINAFYPYNENDSTETGSGQGSGSVKAVNDFSGLTFSDGTDSGIKISDITIDAAGDASKNTASFTISFPEYDASKSWRSYAPGRAVHGGTVSYAFDDRGLYYSAWEQSPGDENGHNRIMVSCYDGSEWKSVGGTLDIWGSDPIIRYCGGRLYAAYKHYENDGKDYYPVVKYYDGQDWKEVEGLSKSSGNYFDMDTDGSSLYLAASSLSSPDADTDDICTIYKLNSSGAFEKDQQYSGTDQMYSDMCILPAGDKVYFAYRNPNKGIYVKEKYEGIWRDNAFEIGGNVTDMIGGTCPSFAVNGDKCYLATSPQGSGTVNMYCKDINKQTARWAPATAPAGGKYTGAELKSYDGVLYGAFAGTSDEYKGISVKKLTGTSWDDVGLKVIGSSVNDFDLNFYKGYCYAGYDLGTAESEYNHDYTRRLAVTASAEDPIAPEDIKERSITYVLNGGIQNSRNASSFKGPAGAVLYPASKKGYLFSGWYADEDYNSRMSSIAAGTERDVTVYAKWMPVKYNIVFRKNKGRKGRMKVMKSLKYDKAYRLNKNRFQRRGYKFIGWSLKRSGKAKIYKNRARIKNLAYTNGKTVVLYARWKKGRV